MIDYDIVRNISVIREAGTKTLELNVVRWGKNLPKYDLRKWNDGEPEKGITLNEEELESLFYSIGEELDLLEDSEEELYEEDFEEDDLEDDEEYEDVDGIVEEPIDYRSFFIHGNMNKCDNDGHDYHRIIAVIPLLTKDKVVNIEVPAYHCIDCHAYYISEYS